MKIKGKITSWNDARGYGFISPYQKGERVFVHVKAFKNRRRRPVVGDVVSFYAGKDARGRPRAENVAIAGAVQAGRRKTSPRRLAYGIVAGFLCVVGGCVMVWTTPLTVLWFYLAISLITFGVYGWDKSAAERGAWRVSENTLHLLSLAGGWPGALLAQTHLRHKSRKQPFRSLFWITVMLNGGVFVWLLTPDGLQFFNTMLTTLSHEASIYWGPN